MARVKMTEFRAKRLLLGEGYSGVSVTHDRAVLPKSGTWVVKVDQGIKKRFKQGLVKVGVETSDIVGVLESWQKLGFKRFLIEPVFEHEKSEEQYLSLERVRNGVRILHATLGGVDIEASRETVKEFLVESESDIAKVAWGTNIPEGFLLHTLNVFEDNFFSFLEINPLIVRGDTVTLLDAAVLVDSTGAFFSSDLWSEADIVGKDIKNEAERRVDALDATTPASLKLSVLNQNGSLFFLLSAGGGSIVVADEAKLLGAGKEIGNFGEYSGGPSRQETYLYAKEILDLLLASHASKKALVIAGPIANFTDVKVTFMGIIDALEERKSSLVSQKIKIFVRRGGPNEREGLSLMEEFLRKEDLLGAVHGSQEPITKAVGEAVRYITS